MLTLALANLSCRQEASLQRDLELTGSWKLESIVEDNVQMPATNNQLVTSMVFKDKGELEARTASNFISGYYETGQQNTMQIAGGGTQRTETAWGERFINALPAIDHYELKPDRLILYYQNTNQLIFSRMIQ
ncbi:META domain-containing protein [Dyadobacter jejuensis]|uniref:META domain-containing protein n=2 Tax=Dyadobacter jejuensis TaxID=1082580 RepID=A0A316AAW7_9BACT|nr:META domain-containing protein [Dyadobacter jejuensis]